METDLNPTDLVAEEHNKLCVLMFRSVLTPCLYEYEPEILSQCFTQDLVVKTLDSVPRLRTLCLTKVSYIDGSAQLATSIHHLGDLQVFNYRIHCTDEVVRQLGLNCPHLTEVSFLDSLGVTNDCVPHLLQLRELKFLNFSGTQIDSKHYGLLLSQLRNIADIRFKNREDVLHHIAPETLDTIIHVYDIADDINMQIRKFPKTTNLHVFETEVDLSGVTAWTELRVLQISYADCLTVNMNATLTGIGHKLTELILLSISNLNLQDIITLCKSLKSLVVSMCSILPLNADTPLNPQSSHFRNLKYLRIHRHSDDRTDYSYVRYYVNLEKVDLYRVGIFSVEFMREVLRRGTLANLKTCYIQEPEAESMTFEVLQLLIQHCSHLKLFGFTSRIRGLNPDNIQELKREMLVGNFDIDIM
jgi:hypothetical protein